MFIYIKNILIVIFEVFCCKIFFETFGNKRYKNLNWINIVQLISLCVCGNLFAFIFSSSFVVKQLANIIAISLIMYWHINISYKKSVVLAILYEGLMLMVDYVAFSINIRLFSNNDVILEQHMTEGTLVVLLGKVILFLCILLIRKQFDKKSTEILVDTEWVRFLFFPVFTIAIISAMLSTFEYVETSKQANVLFIIAFGVAGMNIVVFYLLNDVVNREIQLHEHKVFQLQAKSQADIYRSISENFDEQKRKTHEYKNQIMCIESLLGKKQYLELEKYVKKIYGNLNKELDVINTNNVIVNAILNTKYQESVEKGIVFVFRINDLSDLRINDEDVVTILSNLLNNAIEACEKCIEKKVIQLKFVKEDNAIIISVKNTFNHTICYENGEIKSTKLSKTEEHGIGIKNIKRIIDKYGGSYIIREQDKEFYFSIIIPVE